MTLQSSTDIIVTWPKSKALATYLLELRKAVAEDLQINYRLASQPKSKPNRCYMVYDGLIRGYNDVIGVVWRGAQEVSRVESDAWAGFWPEGHYVVRDPSWRPIRPIEMAGFRGFRYWPSNWPVPDELADRRVV